MTVKVSYSGRERRCPMCKRIFILYEGWVYRRNRGMKELIFCSWKCLREYEKNDVSPIQRRDMICQAIRDGLTNAEITSLLTVDSRQVDYWRKKIEKEDKENECETGREGGSEED